MSVEESEHTIMDSVEEFGKYYESLVDSNFGNAGPKIDFPDIWLEPSMDFVTWNGPDLFEQDCFYLTTKDIKHSKVIPYLMMGASLVIDSEITYDSPMGVRFVDAQMSLFLRMCRIHTPALFDLPFVFYEKDGMDVFRFVANEVYEWVQAYDTMIASEVVFMADESWGIDSAENICGFVSRFLLAPTLTEVCKHGDETLISGPMVNYPSNHHPVDAIKTLALIAGVTPQWSESAQRIVDEHEAFVRKQAIEFVSFLYKFRYNVADSETLEEVIGIIEPHLRLLLPNLPEQSLFEYVTQPKTLVKGILNDF